MTRLNASPTAVHPPRHGQPFTDNPPLTVPDLARETGHSERSIRRWIATRHITPAAKISRSRYYWLSDILVAERDDLLRCQQRFLATIGRHADE